MQDTNFSIEKLKVHVTLSYKGLLFFIKIYNYLSIHRRKNKVGKIRKMVYNKLTYDKSTSKHETIYTRRNLVLCNHSIYDYMQINVIYNYALAFCN